MITPTPDARDGLTPAQAHVLRFLADDGAELIAPAPVSPWVDAVLMLGYIERHRVTALGDPVFRLTQDGKRRVDELGGRLPSRAQGDKEMIQELEPLTAAEEALLTAGAAYATACADQEEARADTQGDRVARGQRWSECCERTRAALTRLMNAARATTSRHTLPPELRPGGELEGRT